MRSVVEMAELTGAIGMDSVEVSEMKERGWGKGSRRRQIDGQVARQATISTSINIQASGRHVALQARTTFAPQSIMA
jgi:hypothetical protein